MNFLKRAGLWLASVGAGWTLFGQSEPLMEFAFNITFIMEFWRQFWFEAWHGLGSLISVFIGESLSIALTFLLLFYWALVPFLPPAETREPGAETPGSRQTQRTPVGGLRQNFSIPFGLLIVVVVFAVKPAAGLLNNIDIVQNSIVLVLIVGFSLLLALMLGRGMTDGRYDPNAVRDRLKNMGFWFGLFVFMNIVGDLAPLVRRYLTDLLF